MEIYSSEKIPKDFYKKIEFETLSSVKEIISDVRLNGDSALKKYSKQFGDGDINELRLTENEIENTLKNTDKDTINAIKEAIKNISDFATIQLKSVSETETIIQGNTLGQKICPLNSVGCYIPGGNYPLPSTAIMTITPAKVAGVKRIVAISPKIQPITIVAAHLAGATEIYRIGGVQGIAALAYGTESIKKVNKITGPGNKYVTSAKKQVYGECGIDFLAGPSEVLIIADNSAIPEFVAADMLAQCEHDKDARAYLLCESTTFAQKVLNHANNFLENLATKEIASEAFSKSIAIVVNNLEEAINISEERAPEHLELCFKNAEKYVNKFSNYGSIFIGNYSAEVFGDYITGTNHTLPTNQVAKYTGGLSVFDYIKIQTYQIVKKDNLERTATIASFLAEKEGLFAHKLAADIRFPNRLKLVLNKKNTNS